MPSGKGSYGSKVGRPKMSAIAGKKLVKKKKPVKKKRENMTYYELFPNASVRADKGIKLRKAFNAKRKKAGK